MNTRSTYRISPNCPVLEINCFRISPFLNAPPKTLEVLPKTMINGEFALITLAVDISASYISRQYWVTVRNLFCRERNEEPTASVID